MSDSEKSGADFLAARYLQAARMAVDHFPVEVEALKLVAQSENVTFRVSAPGGDSDYVLRLHRPGYNSLEELESERQWTCALKRTGVPVQDSLETRTGEHYVLIDIPGTAEQRYAGMTSWHEGVPLRDFLDSCSDRQERQRRFARFGEIAAAFHHQATHWQAPPGFVRRRLDVDALLGEGPFWGRFWEHRELDDAERGLLLRARDGLRASLSAYGEKKGTFSLIHADFTPDNIICNGDELAVIDFDDSAYGWHMYDMASALIECLFEDDFDALKAAFLNAYLEQRSLAKEDLGMLPDFLLVRGMAIIGWFHQRPECSANAYFEKFKNWVLEECRRRGH